MTNENLYDSTFDLITNDNADSKIMNMKSNMILEIREVTSGKYTQKDLANKLGVTQPRVSKLLNGHLYDFSLQELIKYLIKLDVTVEIFVD
ncbi:MAG: hypothetical protein CL489_08615 [Acidobacteria bacterium]|nr:hypothetical protein [Acidobacteriota bacterium]|tara:strand:- start:37579 stop:37851 length:273 start_codon:yes stop_codon:yes gene_type:complete